MHPYADFFDSSVVTLLQRAGVKHLAGAVQLYPEIDIRNESVPADTYWLWFGNLPGFPDVLPAEGKLYIPHKSGVNGTLIHYSPSGPVGNAGRFERRYIAGLVRAGYPVFTARRNGSYLCTDHAKEVINAPYRISLAEICAQSHVGGHRPEGYMPTDALNEPVVTLCGLEPAFDKIHLLSQSFGSAAHYHAVTKLSGHQRLLAKLGTIVNIAGYVGKYVQDDCGLWDGTALPAQQFVEFQVAEMHKTGFNYCTKYGTSEFAGNIAQVAQANERIQVPDTVNHVFFNCVNDPFIAGPRDQHSETLRDYGPPSSRKRFVSMQAPPGDPRPHSMDFLTVADLISALETEKL